MKIDPNDPRLTAYALGELDDTERATVETLLKDDEAARREVETIRRASTMVTDELQSEPCPRLTPDQLAVIRERFSAHEIDTHAFPWWRILSWSTTLGAVAIVLAVMMLPALNRASKRPLTTPQEITLEPQPSIRKTASAPNTFQESEHAIPLTRYSVAQSASSAPTLALQVPAVAGVSHLDDGVSQQQPSSTSHNGNEVLLTDANAPLHRENLGYGPVGAVSGISPSPQFSRSGELAKNTASQKDVNGTLFFDDARVQEFSDRQQSRVLTAYRREQSESIPYRYIGTESYSHPVENGFVTVALEPLSTFSLDVDTASYANVRRFLNQGQLPPRDAVRIEEMLNYFPYDYPTPRRGDPFALYVEMAECPWNSAHRLALVALKARDIAPRKVQPMNLVFLIDVSGSMGDPNKLSLIKQSLRLLVDRLTARDRVAIVVYAGDSRVALPSTGGDDKETILAVIDSLEASGSTNGGAGIQSAYREATANFIEGGVNRVILATDGDFNVGITDQNELVRMIQQQSKSGVFLTILGVGMGNLKDATMQKLADKGNGNYAYIDTLDEANKVLVEQMRGTLVTVAKDAKMQIEFNPALVQSYRLIGYEKRMLRAKDFNNDRKDAGEVGAGHTITALYEIVPTGAPSTPGVDPLKYQPSPQTTSSDELMTVKLRYKDPESSSSRLLTAPVKDQRIAWRNTSADFRFAASVATFGLTLRDSPYKGTASFDLALELAQGAQGRDENGYRREFINLVNQARSLHGNIAPEDP